MLKPLLSICIPNYNRAQFLAKNLNSIAKQNQPGIEIVVCDDRSPEDIKSVIEKFKIKYPKVNLKYKQNKINLGFDKNVLKTVSLANGEYCWLLSNDDKILPESINKIIKTIKKHPHLALILINYQRYDHLLKKITSKKMISLKKDHSFNSASNFFFQKTPNAYFNYMGLNCLTMSVNIFKRKYWKQEEKNNKKYTKYNFIHLFILTSIIKKHPNTYYISKPQLQYTANNHRVWSNPIWHDIRHYFLNHLLRLNYDKNKVFILRKELKKRELDEKIYLLGKKFPRLSNFLTLILRKTS